MSLLNLTEEWSVELVSDLSWDFCKVNLIEIGMNPLYL